MKIVRIFLIYTLQTLPLSTLETPSIVACHELKKGNYPHHWQYKLKGGELSFITIKTAIIKTSYQVKKWKKIKQMSIIVVFDT